MIPCLKSLCCLPSALAKSVKQKDSSELKVRSTPYLGVHLTNDSAALQLKERGRASLSSTGTGSGHHWALSVLVFDSAGVKGDFKKTLKFYFSCRI